MEPNPSWSTWQPSTRYDDTRKARRPAFAAALYVARTSAGLSQPKLAKLADIDTSYVSRMEQGVRMPSRAAANRLADALGLDGPHRDRFLAAAGFMPGDVASLIEDEPECGDLLRRLAHPDTPERQRHAIRAAVRTLLDATEAA